MSPMLDALFPSRADNAYRGHRLALWLFGVVVLLRAVIGLNSLFNGHAVAVGADGIPLDSYTPAGAHAVVSLFAGLGLSYVVMSLLCVVVLIRYRALVPLLLALLLLDQVSRSLIKRWL